MNPEARTDEGGKEEVLEITEEEVQTAINKLKKGKASDNNGIRAEDIKTCDDTTKEIIRQIFNEVIKQGSCTPETWRMIPMKVIHKKKGAKKMSETITHFVLSVQIVLDHSVQQIIFHTRPNATRGSRRVPPVIPTTFGDL